MMTDFEDAIRQLIEAEKLPLSFADTVTSMYLPLAAALAADRQAKGETLVVGLNGAQGTGKSTLTAFLQLILAQQHGLPTAAFSLDDIYLTQAQRQQLSKDVHPLLKTRGVPGTHDIDLGVGVIQQLLNATTGQKTLIPAFDKAVDDRKPASHWPHFIGKPEVIIVEGWCAGAAAQGEAQLAQAVNELERTEDPDGIWRHYVNHQLEGDYGRLFTLFDRLMLIQAPSWEQVYQWRLLQEDKLRLKCQREGLESSALMTPDELVRFIQHYERITRHTLGEMPDRADYLLTMDADHRITALQKKGG